MQTRFIILDSILLVQARKVHYLVFCWVYLYTNIYLCTYLFVDIKLHSLDLRRLAVEVFTGQQAEVGGCVCAPASLSSLSSLPRLTPDYLLMPRASRSMLVANNKVDTAHTGQWA